MNTPEKITSLKPSEIFVFGSNLAGRHGAGAALLAVQRFGAKRGVKRREREAEISRLKQELSKMTASADALYGCIKDIDDLTYHELDCLKKHEVLTGKPLSFG